MTEIRKFAENFKSVSAKHDLPPGFEMWVNIPAFKVEKTEDISKEGSG